MKTKFIFAKVGIVLTALGISLTIFYISMAYSAQQHYTELMCAVAWTFSCITVNNAIIWGMSGLALGLVLVAIGVILLIKSRKKQTTKCGIT